MRTAPDNFPKLIVNARVRFKPEAGSAFVEPVGTIFEVGYCSVKLQWDDEHPVSLVCGEEMKELEAA